MFDSQAENDFDGRAESNSFEKRFWKSGGIRLSSESFCRPSLGGDEERSIERLYRSSAFEYALQLSYIDLPIIHMDSRRYIGNLVER